MGWDTVDGQTVIARFRSRITHADRETLFCRLEKLDEKEWTEPNVRVAIDRFGADGGYSIATTTAPKETS